MPTRQIDYRGATESLNGAKTGSTTRQLIATSHGLALLEIQGELNIPRRKPNGLTAEEDSLFIKEPVSTKFSELDREPVDLVKFGRLELDEASKSAVLYISTSQRLIGKLETFDPPLGVLRVCKEGNESCNLLDVISMRVVFRQRPLPIM